MQVTTKALMYMFVLIQADIFQKAAATEGWQKML